MFSEVTLCFFTSQKTLMKMNGLLLVSVRVNLTDVLKTNAIYKDHALGTN